MTLRVMALRIVTGLVLVSGASCTAHRGDTKGGPGPDSDPLAGPDLGSLHSHGHDLLEVSGRLTCAGTCDMRRIRVLSKRYVDRPGYAEAPVVVEPDGRFHGDLPISYGGTAESISYFPQALVFTSAGCRDTVVAVSSPWSARVVEMRCN